MTVRSKSKSSKKSLKQSFDVCWKGGLGDYITSLDWSSDGRWWAACSAAGEVAMGMPGESFSVLLEGAGQAINCLGFSADGQYLAAAGQAGEVFVWSLTSGSRSVQVLHQSSKWIDRLTWHPVEPWLAIALGSQVQVWDVLHASLLTEQTFAASSALGLDWNDDGRLLAANGHGGVKVWDSKHWDAEPTFIEVPGASLWVDWSPDGTYLASGNFDRTLTVVEWGSPPPWLMQGFPGKVRQVKWMTNSAGQTPLIAAACMEGVTLWQMQGSGWKSQVLQKHQATVSAIAPHSTCPLLASAAQDGQVCLWNCAKPDKPSLQQSLKGASGGFSAIAWQPKGDYLAAGGNQGELILWTPSTRGTGFQKL